MNLGNIEEFHTKWTKSLKADANFELNIFLYQILSIGFWKLRLRVEL